MLEETRPDHGVSSIVCATKLPLYCIILKLLKERIGEMGCCFLIVVLLTFYQPLEHIMHFGGPMLPKRWYFLILVLY